LDPRFGPLPSPAANGERLWQRSNRTVRPALGLASDQTRTPKRWYDPWTGAERVAVTNNEADDSRAREDSPRGPEAETNEAS
jgi:hypothetical protein